MVHVNNRTNGNRILTYVLKSKQNGFVSINGAASKLFQKGDTVHVLAFKYLKEDELDLHHPLLLLTDQDNNVIECKPYLID